MANTYGVEFRILPVPLNGHREFQGKPFVIKLLAYTSDLTLRLF